MLKRLAETYKRHSEIINYLMLGIATTITNFVVYYLLLNLCGCSATISNVVAWFISVLVAFVTNKPFAFKSYDWSFCVTFPEFVKFVGFRIGSGAMETVFLGITVDFLEWNGNIMKLLISVVVVIVNYYASKLFVFRK